MEAYNFENNFSFLIWNNQKETPQPYHLKFANLEIHFRFQSVKIVNKSETVKDAQNLYTYKM